MRRAIPILLVLLLACGPMFYEAPPSLGTYPERLPAKRWHHLFLEASPPDAALPDAKALDETCRKLPETLAPLTPEKRLREIDRLLSENRGGPYSSVRANFLHELREISAVPGLLEEAGPYFKLRIAHDAQPIRTPPETRPWDMDEDQFKALHDIYAAAVKQRNDELSQRTAGTSPSMKPYWMVRHALVCFNSGLYRAAADSFANVVTEFPGHPRAEAAALMQARSLIEQSRLEAGGKDDPQPDALRDDAERLLHEFITRYPKGRFTPDAEGWLGAIAWDRKQLGRVVRQQLARLDRQPTRETTGSVLRECDSVFKRLLEDGSLAVDTTWLDPDDVFDVATVARHPLVARLFIQHCIDPSADVELPLYWDDGVDGGRATINFLNRRIFQPRPLIRTILKELGREMLKIRSAPDADTLTMLAWAATIEGEHGQALALLDRVDSRKPTDEVLHARAIVLQRIGRHEEAVAAFDRLGSEFPNSILTGDIDYRRSISLFRAGKSGMAIAVIGPKVIKRIADNDSGRPQDANLPVDPTIDDQLFQWFDTLVQFCPLEQLQEALAAVAADARCADVLRNILRTRAIAAERFDVAEKCLTPQPLAVTDEYEWPESKLAPKRRMTRDDWNTHAAPLAALYAAGTGGAGGDPAATQLRIAREWMARRGQLTLPAVSINFYAQSEEEKQDLLRRKNAIELGFPREQIERELDLRDEASHALQYALKAAESSDPAIAAPALELANQCLFRRAEFSLYQKSRALEKNDTELSKSIHRQLIGRFPKSPEAKRSVWFVFSPAAGPWMPGDYNPSNSASALMQAIEGAPADPIEEAQDGDGAQVSAILARFDNLDPKTPLAKIRRDIQTAIRDLAPHRANADPENAGDILDAIKRLDSLRCAAALRGITTADFIAWAADETEALPPAFKSLLDFKDRISPVINEDGDITGLKNDTIEGWRAFLELYPDSPMAEAASLRMTRLIARTFRSSRMIAGFQFPDAPIPNGYKHLKVVRNDTSNDPAAVLAAIRDHEKRFPMGRYQDDLNLLRAGALIDEGDHAQAMAILCNILDNPVQRDLHVITALEFADISQRLLDPAQRAGVAKAMRGTPGAMTRLKRLVYGDTFLSRLQPLMPCLAAGVGQP